MNKVLNIFGKDYTEKELEEIINNSNKYDIKRDGSREVDYICDNMLVPFFVIYYYKIILKSNPKKFKYLYTKSPDWKEEHIIMDKDYYE